MIKEMQSVYKSVFTNTILCLSWDVRVGKFIISITVHVFVVAYLALAIPTGLPAPHIHLAAVGLFESTTDFFCPAYSQHASTDKKSADSFKR